MKLLVEDIDDLNHCLLALAGGLGALGSDTLSRSYESGIRKELMELQQADYAECIRFIQTRLGFLQGAENVGREG